MSELLDIRVGRYLSDGVYEPTHMASRGPFFGGILGIE